MGQQPQVGAELVRRLAQAGQRVEHLAIDLARVGLAGDRVDVVEAHLAGDQPVELADLVVVAAEQGEEAGLRAGRALGAAEAQGRQAVLDLVQVEQEIVAPQAGPLADGGQLGRLEVREAQRRPGRASCSANAGQGVDDADQPVAQQVAGPRASGSGRCCR